MDYNVQYHIDINGTEASSQLTNISQQVQKLMPPMINYFKELNRVISKCNSGMAAMQKIGKMPKLDINTSEAFKKINSLKTEIQKLKNTTINLRVNETSTTTPRRRPGRLPSGKTSGGSGDGSFGYYRSRLGTTGLLTSFGVPYAGMVGTVAIGRGLSSIVKSSVEYEHTMDLAHSILKSHDHDLSTFQSRFESMSKHMRQIGVETQFTATQIAGATKFLAMAGLNVAQIDAAMKPVANLAVIGDSDLGLMADLVTNIVTGYGIKNKDIAAASDIMAAVSTGANTTVTEMAEAFKYAAGQLSVAGISFNEASAAIGILGNAGMKATVAGTGLRAMMMRMVNPTRKAQKTLDALGISFTKLDKNGKPKIKSLQEAFEDLHKAGAGLKELNTIFDKTASKAAIALMVNVENFKKLTGESLNSFGIAEALATKRQDTVKGLWYQISSQFTEDGMLIFESITPLIKEYMHDMLDYLKTPQAVEMIRNVVYMFKRLMGILLEIGKWVVDNWDWLNNFIIGGFITRKIYQLTESIFSLAKAFKSVTSVLGGSKTAATGAGTGVLGGVAAFSSLIAVVGGGVLAFISHLDTLNTKAETAFKLWAKANDISFTAEPQNGGKIFNNPQTIYEKYRVEMEGNGKDGAYRSMFDHFNRKTLKRYSDDKNENAQYDYEEFGARAATIATSVANNDWHDWHKKQMAALAKAAPLERGNILQQIKKRQQNAYQYVTSTFIDHSLTPNRFLRPGEQILLPTPFGERKLNTVDPKRFKANAIPNTLEYGDQMFKRVGETWQLSQQLMPIYNMLYNDEGRAQAMFKFFDQQTGLNYKEIYDQLLPSKDKEGRFIFRLKDDASKEEIQKYVSQTNERLSALHGDEAVKSWWHYVPIQNSILGNNLASSNGNVDISGLGEDPTLSTGGGGGGGKGTSSTLRHITVNIDKLMSVDSMSVNTDEDIDAFKEKLKKALMDVIKDVEISY